MREHIARYLEVQNAQGKLCEHGISLGRRLVLGLQIIGGIVTIPFLLMAFRMSASEANARRTAMKKVQLLSAMANMLQSSGGEDAKAVFTARRFICSRNSAAACTFFNNFGDRLKLLTSWNEQLSRQNASLLPGDC